MRFEFWKRHAKTLSEDIGRSQERRTKLADIPKPLLVMRHGPATYSEQDYQLESNRLILQGNLKPEAADRLKLSAQEIIQYLQKNKITEITLVNSPKRRCQQTADIVATAIKQAGINVTRFEDNNLRDVDAIGDSYDRWESQVDNGENWFAAWIRASQNNNQFEPGEESFANLQKRVEPSLEKIAALDRVVLVVSHEEVLASIANSFDQPWQPPTHGEVWYFEPKTDVLGDQ